jgi:hypothetical protein
MGTGRTDSRDGLDWIGLDRIGLIGMSYEGEVKRRQEIRGID